MSRVYGDPINVWSVDDRPVRFVWRGRLYTVRQIHERWASVRDWWKQTTGTEADDPDRREFWQLSAARADSGEIGVYEMRRDVAEGTWLLSRAWD